MIELKTSKQKAEARRKRMEERDKTIYDRFIELSKVNSLSDAVCITANEFCLSLPTIYEIRKRVESRLEASLQNE